MSKKDNTLSAPAEANRIIRLPVVKTKTGISKSSIYARIKEGDFPKPIKLGERSVGWLATDIDRWIAERVMASREVA